jgi:CrcB protein
MDISWSNILAIAIGAIPGALARYYLIEWSKRTLGTGFPYGTFLINITGCFAIGFFATIASTIADIPVAIKLLIETGFLSSYTTFSTYEWDTLMLLRGRKLSVAAFYSIGSVFLSVLGVFLGSHFAIVTKG